MPVSRTVVGGKEVSEQGLEHGMPPQGLAAPGDEVKEGPARFIGLAFRRQVALAEMREQQLHDLELHRGHAGVVEQRNSAAETSIDYLPSADGTLVLMRQGDGIHWSRAGGDRVADAVLTAIKADWPV